jgi:hypothetical protein
MRAGGVSFREASAHFGAKYFNSFVKGIIQSESSCWAACDKSVKCTAYFFLDSVQVRNFEYSYVLHTHLYRLKHPLLRYVYDSSSKRGTVMMFKQIVNMVVNMGLYWRFSTNTYF